MTTALKAKPFGQALEPSARLFGQLEELLSSPGKRKTPKIVSTELQKSVRQLQQQASLQEIHVLQDVVRELSSQLEGLASTTRPDSAEEARAAREDAVIEQVLRRAQAEKSPVTSTPHSIQQGERLMAEARQKSVATLHERIEREEYITSAKLQAAWHVKRQAISNALAAGRIFAVVGPSGDNYYPSFYADESLDRRVVEKVTRALGALPAASKYHFFTSQFTPLGRTPLEALRRGSVQEVLAAASSFAER